MRRSTTTGLALAGALLAALTWAQEAPRPAETQQPASQEKEAEKTPDEASKPPNFREEVVVTAQKRSEAVQEIPASVTVVGGQLLEQQRADDFQALVPLVPGLSTTATRP